MPGNDEPDTGEELECQGRGWAGSNEVESEGPETTKVGICAACHCQSQEVETRCETLWALYSDGRRSEEAVCYITLKNCLHIPSQAALFMKRKGW